MNKLPEHNDETEDLLDQVIEELRNQSVPPMPSELLVFAKSAVTERASGKRVPTPLSLIAVAAAVIMVASATYLVTHGGSDRQQVAEISKGPNLSDDPPSNQDVGPDGIVMVELSSSPVLSELDAGLDELAVEIMRLRRQAELLDVRRRATELTGSLAMLD